MSIGLQELDCNCNDCIFMIRNQERLKESQALHKKWSDDSWKRKRESIKKKADSAKQKGNEDSCKSLMKEYRALKPDYSIRSTIQYGTCEPVGDDLSFIPNTIQVDTQDCFQHRRTINKEI